MKVIAAKGLLYWEIYNLPTFENICRVSLDIKNFSDHCKPSKFKRLLEATGIYKIIDIDEFIYNIILIYEKTNDTVLLEMYYKILTNELDKYEDKKCFTNDIDYFINNIQRSTSSGY